MILEQNKAYNDVVFMTLASDHITGATGKTLTITLSKNGAAFASVTPTVTELSNGWYKIAWTSAHIDTLGPFAVHITAAACDAADYRHDVYDQLAANVEEINGDPVVVGVVRFTVLDNGNVRKGRLRIVKNDSYLTANGNPIVFQSDTFPDLTDVASAKLTIRDKLVGGTVRMDHIVSVNIDVPGKEITFDLTTTNTNISIGSSYLYDLELHYAGGTWQTVITDVAEILDNVS